MKRTLVSVVLIMLLVSVSYAQDVDSVRKAKSEAIYIGNVFHNCREGGSTNPCIPQGCTSNEIEMRDAILSVRNINFFSTDHIRVRLTLHHLTLPLPTQDCSAAVWKQYVYPTTDLGPYENVQWSTNDIAGNSWIFVTNPNPSCPPLKQCLICDYCSGDLCSEGYFWLEWWSVSGKIVNAPAVSGMIRYQDSTGFKLSSDFKPIVVLKNIVTPKPQ